MFLEIKKRGGDMSLAISKKEVCVKRDACRDFLNFDFFKI